MANSPFTIVITAVDKATATVKKVNEAFSKFTRPVAEMRQAMKSMSKEAGFDKFSKSLEGISRGASDIADKLKSISPAMSAVIGTGTIAGVVALETGWARAGVAVSNLSSRTRQSTRDLQAMAAVAQKAGVSGDAMTGSLKALGTAMQDAFYGRNQDAITKLAQIGIRMKDLPRLANGGMDAVRMFEMLADRLDGIDPNAVPLVTQALGIDESLIPLLQRGGDGIARMRAEMAKFSGFSEENTRKAAELHGSFASLGIAFESTKNILAANLQPIFGPVLKWMSDWITKNEELSAGIMATVGAIGAFIGIAKIAAFAGAITKIAALSSVGAAVGGATAAVGGATAAVGTAGIGASLVPLIAGLGGVALIGKGLFDIYRGLGFGASAASPAETPVSPSTGGSAPIGIRQNNPGNLRRWSGMPSANGFAVFPDAKSGISAMARQLQIYGERGNNTLSGILNTYAPAADGNNVPAYISDVAGRTGYDPNAPLDLNDPKVVSPLLSAMIAHENGQQPYSKEMIDDAVSSGLKGQKVEVEVNFRQAPPGMTANVRSGGAQIFPRIDYSMPTAVTP